LDTSRDGTLDLKEFLRFQQEREQQPDDEKKEKPEDQKLWEHMQSFRAPDQARKFVPRTSFSLFFISVSRIYIVSQKSFLSHQFTLLDALIIEALICEE
jgi:hypothetical protein